MAWGVGFYNEPMHDSASVSATLSRLIRAAIDRNGGWLPFDRFMAMALYAPGLGYYANHGRKFGVLPHSGSDFVTAPELSSLFGRALANQVAQALQASGTHELWEFGAGSGALAEQLLSALGDSVRRYTIVDLSGTLRERQRERLAAHSATVQWADALPEQMAGVIVGNEVLDAMPVQLLEFDGAQWFERGVVLDEGAPAGLNVGQRAGQRVGQDKGTTAAGAAFAWGRRATALRPPFGTTFPAGAVVEVHPQAEAFVATLAERLTRGAAFFIDYGFPEAEYYHAQRSHGTLMCHRAHRADADPLVDVGLKDITAHVDFTALALAAQNAGLEVIGYTTQAHFLMNCGVLDLLEGADLKTIANTQKLLTEHEMGELFKAIGFAKGCDAAFNAAPIGFARGDRTHTL
jgi:SAM-dependent MidA family methyltransferase